MCVFVHMCTHACMGVHRSNNEMVVIEHCISSSVENWKVKKRLKIKQKSNISYVRCMEVRSRDLVKILICVLILQFSITQSSVSMFNDTTSLRPGSNLLSYILLIIVNNSIR